jgi:hypothetical protein
MAKQAAQLAKVAHGKRLRRYKSLFAHAFVLGRALVVSVWTPNLM